MEFRAHISYLRIAPRKVRLVAGLLRGKRVDQALHQLQILRKGSTSPLRKLLLSAVANAAKQDKKAEDLYVATLVVNEGPRLKRYRPRAFGRAAVILKRSSHITLTLTDQQKGGKKSKLSAKEEAKSAEATEVKKEEKKAETSKAAAPKKTATKKATTSTVKKPRAKK
ncbi:MAG: 50S ribosomal protein L22 [Candidatus Nomurabacteria bacterium]|nr:MAG: 50S ribosomal protein L22 [Candidatus Nomurabacteria bacterium]